MNRIADAKRGAFQARLRHLKQLGFPEGTNTGRGQKATYSFMTYMQLVLAVELMQAGISPTRIVRMIKGNWFNLEFDVLVSLCPLEYLDRFSPKITPDQANFTWVFSLEALRDLTETGENEYDYHETIETIPMSELSRRLGSDDWEGTSIGEMWRTLIIQGRLLVHISISELMKVVPTIAITDFYQDVEEQLVEKGRKIQRLSELIDLRSAKK